jgi:hypothetical protein
MAPPQEKAESKVTKYKPGQRYPTPTPGNPDRCFYETLYYQKKDSAMAQDWCLLYGVLSEADAKKVMAAQLKRR